MTERRGGVVRGRGKTSALNRWPLHVDSFGVLRYGERWISLSPTQESIMRVLILRAGRPVSRAELAAAAWPGGGPDYQAINVHMHRLRPRLSQMGLVIHTLRGRGFVLEESGG